jgi:hypothetical protein
MGTEVTVFAFLTTIAVVGVLCGLGKAYVRRLRMDAKEAYHARLSVTKKLIDSIEGSNVRNPEYTWEDFLSDTYNPEVDLEDIQEKIRMHGMPRRPKKESVTIENPPEGETDEEGKDHPYESHLWVKSDTKPEGIEAGRLFWSTEDNKLYCQMDDGEWMELSSEKKPYTPPKVETRPLKDDGVSWVECVIAGEKRYMPVYGKRENKIYSHTYQCKVTIKERLLVPGNSGRRRLIMVNNGPKLMEVTVRGKDGGRFMQTLNQCATVVLELHEHAIQGDVYAVLRCNDSYASSTLSIWEEVDSSIEGAWLRNV